MNKFEINSVSLVDGQLVFDYTYQPVQAATYINLDVIMKRKTTSVHHWCFETGEPREVVNSIVYPGGLVYSPPVMESTPRGWYCWVYPEDDAAFTDWMGTNCPTADCDHKFNSGDPMWMVYIKDDKEATLFALRWL